MSVHCCHLPEGRQKDLGDFNASGVISFGYMIRQKEEIGLIKPLRFCLYTCWFIIFSYSLINDTSKIPC